MTWIFIFGALYGIALILNIKWCQSSPDSGGALGSIAGVMLTGLATVLALGRNGAQLTPQQWLLPFLCMCFFFMPNYMTAINYILSRKE